MSGALQVRLGSTKVPADKDRFDKILALAVNPGAPDGEASAAFSMLRKLVRENPSLTMPPQPPVAPPEPKPAIDSFSTKVTHISAFWFLIFINSTSEKAFELGLKYQFTCDPLTVQTPMTIQIKHEGDPKACKAFTAHLNWLIEYINSQPPMAA